MHWLSDISRFWPLLGAGFNVFASALASGHALLHKRDPRAATLWLGVIWLVPALGPLLYLALGINRLQRRTLPTGTHPDPTARFQRTSANPGPRARGISSNSPESFTAS